MALLGTFIDKTTLVSLTGAAALTTLSHSLGTTPDEVRIQLRSVAAGSQIVPLAEGGNASLLTIGNGGNSTIAFNVLAQYFWSPTR